MEIGYLQEVKAIIKSLVLSCPNAITIDALNRDYRSTEGIPIPFRKLGFQTLESFLLSIPDTVNVYGSGPTASVSIVRNEKSDHIHQMVCQQKKARPRTRVKSSRASVAHYDYNFVNRQLSAELKAKTSNRYTSDNLPTSNIHLTHTITEHTPRTVKKCQLIELSASCVAKKMAIDKAMKSSNIPRSIPSNLNLHNQGAGHCPDISDKMYKSSALHSQIETHPENKNTQIFKSTTHRAADIIEKLFEKCTISSKTEFENRPIISPSEKANQPIISTSVKTAARSKSVISNKVATKPTIFDLNNSLDEQNRINEMEEAVPAYAADNLVFRMDFPENTMTFGKKIEPYRLPNNVRRGSVIGIFISEIHSPYKFWFHIYREHHELDTLMLQIERFYTSLDPEGYCIPRVCICPGQVCAALYKGLWHRAEILSPVIDDKTKVLFVDYGTVSEVYTENIKFLPTAFAKLPKQAIRGSLSHVRPKNMHWCQESINYFLSMSCELMLYGQISEIYEEKRIIYMVLCDTNGSEVVQINRELVEKGFAAYDDEWQKYDKGGKRLHHMREDFPTFSMLENGEYPTFSELIDLKNKGIDYEWIIDHNIYHPGRLDLNENVPEAIRKLPFQLLTTNPFRREIYLQLQHLI